DRRVLEASELVAREATGGELLHPGDELRGSGDAANGFSGDRHGARLAAAVAMSMTLSPNPWIRVRRGAWTAGKPVRIRDFGLQISQQALRFRHPQSPI